VIDNVEGTEVSQLTGLSWEHRADGHCGAGAPRWNVVVRGSDGEQYFLFLGCAAAAHSPTSDPNWMRDSYTSPTLVSIGLTNAYGPAFAAAHEAAVNAGTIEQLYILFDQGTDTPTGGMIAAAGFVYLDNITVTLNGAPKVFTGPWTTATTSSRVLEEPPRRRGGSLLLSAIAAVNNGPGPRLVHTPSESSGLQRSPTVRRSRRSPG
jgi:hypothetical protein